MKIIQPFRLKPNTNMPISISSAIHLLTGENMGTSGSGSFSDYPSGKKGSSTTDSTGDGSGINQNSCEKAIGEIDLEEVATLDYFKNHQNVPNIDDEVELSNKLDGGRLVVLCNNLKLGYLPAKYSYLLTCTKEGYSYRGTVIDTTTSPLVHVQIDLGPIGK